ncbi:unnamed protein product [Dracunculus medinensis]|uniref:ShKT domain-containing protein n=1 Tax=Dracunculus medinensis TaxID=318479 RepID=A0A158Q2Y5_DRAME|nr:unnamed protein product [Dracunculus medinensis]
MLNVTKCCLITDYCPNDKNLKNSRKILVNMSLNIEISKSLSNNHFIRIQKKIVVIFLSQQMLFDNLRKEEKFKQRKPKRIKMKVKSNNASSPLEIDALRAKNLLQTYTTLLHACTILFLIYQGQKNYFIDIFAQLSQPITSKFKCLPNGCCDEHEWCRFWASIGECEANSEWMLIMKLEKFFYLLFFWWNSRSQKIEKRLRKLFRSTIL